MPPPTKAENKSARDGKTPAPYRASDKEYLCYYKVFLLFSPTRRNLPEGRNQASLINLCHPAPNPVLVCATTSYLSFRLIRYLLYLFPSVNGTLYLSTKRGRNSTPVISTKGGRVSARRRGEISWKGGIKEKPYKKG